MAQSRKDDHIRLAAAQQEQLDGSENAFDDVDFIHHALAGVDADDVDTSIQLGPWTLDSPIYINGMTGGTDTALPINTALAKAAAATGVPMASGSVGLALDDPETAPSFTVIREHNPDGIVWANLGAGRPLAHAKAAVELLAADGLQLHVNPIQETVMPEGSRNFSAWLSLIEDIVAGLNVPVIVKEVGFGLSAKTVAQLYDVGVEIVDVAGSGGTNFARIENDRTPHASSVIDAHAKFDWLEPMGLTAVDCLLDLAQSAQEVTVLASGGVRNPLDVVRAQALGAKAVGMAGVMLRVAMSDGADGAIEVLNLWKTRIRQIYALLGVRAAEELTSTDVMVTGRSAQRARARNIDVTRFADRVRI
ncbi:MAG: type 2 isopentenyl-diphosphate Delta-isomerase [Yaniella sp.]|uniref:type 2 isopentenyl-diphosphate Delta-isomerase n=1 Tax=Yaniella sp. TaxID=2773929 RepID=UPI002649877C|nr:type 2 isopentenyl-diphosphate Delta-isomerase [Yaniella sp.]MDN6457168.1 type 2 isopentenyl-diphosphate Delta-isomerase [Yaniella sp.]